MMKLIERFRQFRWSRPFWGGLFIIFAGAVIGWFPLGPVTEIIHLGIGGIGGYVCAVLLIAMGLTIWFKQSHRRAAALIAVIVSLISFPVSNLGGFIVGMMAGIIGGCLAFGWAPGDAADADASVSGDGSESGASAEPTVEKVR